MRVGVEVGGTFTDLVLERDGALEVVKVPSTPSAPDRGALAAIDRAGVSLADVRDLVHGSTIATNAIIERKGARVGLVVTRGMRDLLYLQRHNRRRIYDLHYAKPEPVVRRRDVIEVDERVDADGAPVIALDGPATRERLRSWLETSSVEAVAVCLLNSYANPGHETAVADLLRELAPDVPVTCSHEVNREFREYERCTTTTLSAYVQPVVAAYLGRFETGLGERGFTGHFSVMQSNGGRLPAEAMATNAISALFSGPAAGVVGAVSAATGAGERDLITLDMGGTSTDVCLVEAGRPTLGSEVEIDGLPVKTSVIDMVTVGAGGGSIVWVDDGGMLRVGPHSAGADPGPACYGRGGTRATVTDAHLVRGTLQPDALLGGEMNASTDAARRALEPVAAALGLDVTAAADSAIRVAQANIVRAIQRVSTERGLDPRRYVLVPFGGAGPMLAARLAEEIGIAQVLVPPNAGVLSAFGLLASDYVHFESVTRRLAVEEANLAAIRETVDTLAERAATRLASLGVRGAPRLRAVLDMRFIGQAFEIPVALEDLAAQSITVERLARAFTEAHHRVFEFGGGSHGRAEIVSFRVSASRPPEHRPVLREERRPPRAERVIEIVEHGARRQCRRVDRTELRGGVDGPALVEDTTSTLLVPDGWHARVDEHDNVRMRPGGRSAAAHAAQESP